MDTQICIVSRHAAYLMVLHSTKAGCPGMCGNQTRVQEGTAEPPTVMSRLQEGTAEPPTVMSRLQEGTAEPPTVMSRA